MGAIALVNNRIPDLPRLIYFLNLSFLNSHNDDDKDNNSGSESNEALYFYGNVPVPVSWNR